MENRKFLSILPYDKCGGATTGYSAWAPPDDSICFVGVVFVLFREKIN